MSGPCTLRIRTDAFRVELEGDAAFVRAGYAALRDEILGHLHPGGGEAPSHGFVRSTEPDPTEVTVDRPPSDLGPDYLWVYRCTDLYNKVYVLQRSRLVASGLGRVVDLAQVQRVYLESEDEVALEALIPRGKTLWSELTRLGQQRLRTT